jgi:alpha,alpha-trehalase
MTYNELPVFAQRIIHSLGHKPAAAPLVAADVQEAREYIAHYWPTLARYKPKDEDSLVGLPFPYMVSAHEPDHEFDFNEMYYWDTYFMAQGFLGRGANPGSEIYRAASAEKLLDGLLGDQMYLFERFGMVPNASRTYLTSRSQPPFMTSLIFDIYDAFHKDLGWLLPRIALAKREYNSVWMGTKKPHDHKVFKGLSRNYSTDLTHDQTELESGWDYTPRFSRRALDYLPVDLNALLYRYEMDFARAAHIAGDEFEVRAWQRAARKRKKVMTDLMWDRYRGLFYDYDYVQGKRGSVSSLATYYTMWSGLATKQQARAMVRALRRFEHKGGLATTDDLPLNQRFLGGMPTQWAYPNGWAPLHFLAVRGLERYGYHREARRIALKWLRTNLGWFNKNGVFLEKYNVADPDKPPAKGVYPAQTGFGWTNAVFERFCREYVDG